MSLALGLAGMGVCVALGLAAEAFEPPASGAPAALATAAGLAGAGVLGFAVLGTSLSFAAVGLLGFALVALADDVAAGRPARADRVVGTFLVVAACGVPFLRYRAQTFAELRTTAGVLGAPALTGPAHRWVWCSMALLVGLAAAAWLSADAPAARVGSQPASLVTGASAVVLTASFLGPEVSGLRHAGLWALGIVIGVGAQWSGRPWIRRIRYPGAVALGGALVLAGAGAGLAR